MVERPDLVKFGYQAVEKAPRQRHVYGIGTGLYGRLRFAPDDGLRIRYYCFTLLYIPVLLLGKYLTHSEKGAEYVVAKGTLSSFARVWNAFVVVAVLGVGGIFAYQTYTHSPNYLAQQAYNRGMSAVESGNFSTGLPYILSAYRTDTQVSAKALNSLVAMGQAPYLLDQTPGDAALVVAALVELAGRIPTLLETTEQLFLHFKDVEPLAASRLAKAAVVLSGDPEQQEQYRQVQYQLMAMVVKQNPANVDYAIEFAQLEEIYNGCRQCEALLSAHESILGDGEGARILGQIYAARGEVESAYTLLSPYVESRLKIYHELSAEYDRFSEQAWSDMIDHLNSPQAPQAFIDRYEAASTEQEEAELLNELFLQRLQASREFQRIKQDYEASTAIVPVALDLGIVMLNRATTMTDAQARQDQLTAAERTFLAVRNEAGDSDDYQWYLGQVYYWLGKEIEGQQLFDDLLAKYDRSPSVLLSLANVLRDLGASGAAEDLAEEGYENSADQAEKQGFAGLLALLADDVDERLEWLEKSDLDNPFAQADLHSLRASKAQEAGDDEAALVLLDKAISIYKSVPEDSSMHNNIALVYMAKYRLGKDEKDYNQALASLDRALVLEPDSSIILTNSITYHRDKAYRDMLASYLDPTAIGLEADDRLLSFLYRNQQEKEQLLATLLEHPSMQKALSYTNKALLLAPKDERLLSRSQSLYYYLDKTAELEMLEARVAPLSFDLRSSEQVVAAYRRGENDAEAVKAYTDSIVHLQASLAELDSDTNSLEAVVLNSYLLAAHMGLREHDQSVDVEAMTRRAIANHEAHPSARTMADYQNILWLRLIDSLRKQDQRFAEFHDRYHRYYGRRSLLAVALVELEGLRTTVADHTDFRAIEGLLERDLVSFPGSVNAEEWFVLEHLGSELADPVKANLQAAPENRLIANLTSKTSANYEGTALYQYFTHLAFDEQSQAAAILAQAGDLGLDFPASLLSR